MPTQHAEHGAAQEAPWPVRTMVGALQRLWERRDAGRDRRRLTDEEARRYPGHYDLPADYWVVLEEGERFRARQPGPWLTDSEVNAYAPHYHPPTKEGERSHQITPGTWLKIELVEGKVVAHLEGYDWARFMEWPKFKLDKRTTPLGISGLMMELRTADSLGKEVVSDGARRTSKALDTLDKAVDEFWQWACEQVPELEELWPRPHDGAHPRPLTGGQRRLWDALAGRCLNAKELAAESELDTSEDTVRQWVRGLKAAGRDISHRPGRGYFRPDAPLQE